MTALLVLAASSQARAGSHERDDVEDSRDDSVDSVEQAASRLLDAFESLDLEVAGRERYEAASALRGRYGLQEVETEWRMTTSGMELAVCGVRHEGQAQCEVSAWMALTDVRGDASGGEIRLEMGYRNLASGTELSTGATLVDGVLRFNEVREGGAPTKPELAEFDFVMRHVTVPGALGCAISVGEAVGVCGLGYTAVQACLAATGPACAALLEGTGAGVVLASACFAATGRAYCTCQGKELIDC